MSDPTTSRDGHMSPAGLGLGTSRNAVVDAFKLLAAFGVVIIHLAPPATSARALTDFFNSFAVPFFLLISLYFLVLKHGRAGNLRWGDLHCDRLAVPYLAWSAIYLGLRFAKGWLRGEPLSPDWLGVVFFGAAAVQLYFLPLLLVLKSQAFSMILLRRPGRPRLVALGVIVAAWVFCGVGAAAGQQPFVHAFLKAWLYVAAAFLLVTMQSSPVRARWQLAAGVIGCLAVVAAPLFRWDVTWLGVAAGPLHGYAVCALALNLRLSVRPRWILAALAASYGIYLSHVVLIELVDFTLRKAGCPIVEYSLTLKLLFGLGICAACMLFVSFVRSFPRLAYCLLGEPAAKNTSRTQNNCR